MISGPVGIMFSVQTSLVSLTGYEGRHIVSSWYYVFGSDFIVIEVDVYRSGTVLSLIGDHSDYEEVHINQFTALFVPANGNSGISNLVWIDEQNGLMFSIDSTLEKSVMLHIAENIELSQSPN